MAYSIQSHLPSHISDAQSSYSLTFSEYAAAGIPMKFDYRGLLQGLVIAAGMGFLIGANAQDVTGAGASFPAPVYSKWASDYQRATGAKVNYQSIGSSGGMKQIDSRTVDFGASDVPLRDDELAKKGQIQFPTLVGGVVPIVNIRGIAPGTLKLSGSVIAGIYLGKISRWNDPQIQSMNPALPLPDAAIAPVHRADGSGTSYLFTSFLSRSNAEWKDKVGEGTAINWPVGLGGKGNEGVATYVSRVPNSIGYVEFSYVKQSKLAYTLLENSAGKTVTPDSASFAAAAAAADWAKSFYQILTNQPGNDAWPITGATYILMNIRQDDTKKGVEVLKFFKWAFANGMKSATDLDYLPMTLDTVRLIEQMWGKLRDAEGRPLPSL
jgi:phosphate transport system substrate-binding protein